MALTSLHYATVYLHLLRLEIDWNIIKWRQEIKNDMVYEGCSKKFSRFLFFGLLFFGEIIVQSSNLQGLIPDIYR